MKGLRQRGGLVSHLQRKRPSEKPSKQMASDSQQEPREQDDAGGDAGGCVSFPPEGGVFLDDALPCLVSCLPVPDALLCRAVSRTWKGQLSSDVLWQELCQGQWPMARPLRCDSWRGFAVQGGGDFLGRQLLKALRWTVETQAMCPSGHALRRFVVDMPGFYCDVCGQRELAVGMPVWGCCSCNYDKCATCFRLSEAAPLLLAAGATNALGADGWSALHLSARLGFDNIAERLLEARADANIADLRHAYTPLMVGAAHGNREVCVALLRHGAARSMRNKHGRSATDCARGCGRQELQEMLG